MSCKLPSTILREFVQKKTDLKAPLFKSHEVDGGWTCKLVLRDKQGKTEKDRVFWWREKCATKQEAEHRVSVVALAAVAQNGWALEYADESLKKDREFVLAAVAKRGWALRFADDSLKKDREVVLAAVATASTSLQYADESLKKDLFPKG